MERQANYRIIQLFYLKRTCIIDLLEILGGIEPLYNASLTQN